MIDLRPGDNRATLRRMIANGEFVQSVVTDPPYGLVSVTKRFGGKSAAPAQFGKDGAFSRASAGFMGLRWDSTGIERDPEFWRLVHDVMLPGAYIVAFSSSRTYGYMQIAMEQAGFITHPMLGWTFASGFPKAHNASKAIDRELGVERPVIGVDERYVGMSERAKRGMGADQQDAGNCSGWVGDPSQVTGAGSPEARQWDGWAYGGQALKPALEPIYVGQKPFSEKNGALNILKHGVGAINIDGCRVPTTREERDWQVATARPNAHTTGFAGMPKPPGFVPSDHGRHPANLLLDGSDEVTALFPNSKGAAAPASGPTQTGDFKSGSMAGAFKGTDVPPPFYGSSDGSAARFFNSFPHEGPLLHYPKANKRDRAGSKHATVKPVPLMRHLVRLVTPLGGTVLDPFAGSGTTGQAALDEGMTAILCEAEHEYVRDIAARFNVDPGFACRLWQIGELL